MRETSFKPPESQWMRNMVEISILFVIAVVVLRGFFLEGYLISTGSMAPHLLGLHKQVVCPACEHRFAYGITFDDSTDDEESTGAFAACPNCGQRAIAAAKVPACHGDQLLVHKGVFRMRRPRRFESVVFRNPASPGEAYVKRAVGLPGEKIQIIDGDLFVGDQIARKDLETQRDMRIEVFDLAHRPSTEGWQMPLQLQGAWKVDADSLTCSPVEDSGPDNVNWSFLHNWRRSGGMHLTEVLLHDERAEADWQSCLKALRSGPVAWTARLRFDRERQALQLQGVMPEQMQQDLLAVSASDEFRAAVHRLAAMSHLCPFTDLYGYNSSVAMKETPVHDLMVEMAISFEAPPKQLYFNVPVRHRVFRVELDFAARTVRLVHSTTGHVVRTGSILLDDTPAGKNSTLRLELSNFDYRITAACDGQSLFEPLDVACSVSDAQDISLPHDADSQRQAEYSSRIFAQQSRFGFGVLGGSVRVPEFRIYRDVHYTEGHRKHGVEHPHAVPADCYFMLGDNSPVSSDSRNWEDPDVSAHLLVGKPFIVHLPSKPGKLTISGIELPIRIPDFERIRYIQ